MLHLLSCRVAHRAEYIRLDGTLVSAHLEYLHFYAELVEKTFIERRHTAETMDIDTTYRVEDNAVGCGGNHIITLAVRVGIRVYPFAELRESGESVDKLLSRGHTHCSSVAIKIDAFYAIVISGGIQSCYHLLKRRSIVA